MEKMVSLSRMIDVFWRADPTDDSTGSGKKKLVQIFLLRRNKRKRERKEFAME